MHKNKRNTCSHHLENILLEKLLLVEGGMLHPTAWKILWWEITSSAELGRSCSQRLLVIGVIPSFIASQRNNYLSSSEKTSILRWVSTPQFCSVSYMSLRILYLYYKDAIQDGDSDRLLVCWKYLLPIFIVSDWRNYSLEVSRMLYSYFILSPRQKHQLLWSWFTGLWCAWPARP